MTKKIDDLFASFTDISFDEQLERIRTARHNRTIERPVAAVKRVKKESKKKEKAKTDVSKMLLSLPPEKRAELIKRLQEEQKSGK
jgi:DNA-directed RNA polymerase specialized sigma24 family protein